MNNGDWERIYLQNADLVYRFLLPRCHDKYLAEDLTSETFLEAYRCYPRYNGSCKLSVWLCQIGKHLLYRHYTKHPGEYPLGEQLTSSSAEEIVVRREVLRTLEERLSALPPPMRDVVRLRVAENLSFAEIGKRMDKNEVWARVTFHRAKKLLRKE